MKHIEELLRHRAGIDVRAIGHASVERIVRLRMKKLGLADVPAYRRLVESVRSEWDELLEAVVVTETCFFREHEPFSAFVRLAWGDWLPSHPTGTLRVLSVPCASGEEPYSAAIALLDSGFPENRFQIDGIDISRRALDRAATGIYRNNSFRGGDVAFRDRHFSRAQNGYLLNAAPQRRVRLHRGNLLDDESWRAEAHYDFIFCRNLLIYFDSRAQEKALARLRSLLTPAGVLFVGPAEIPLVVENGFATLPLPRAFACCDIRATTGDPLTSTRVTSVVDSPSLSSPRLALSLSGQPVPDEGKPPSGGVTVRTIAVELTTAGRLADEGRLKEAAEICQAYLRSHRTSARAYYLLGLVHDADGHPRASDFYQKALYLDPGHREALWQLALLARKNGEWSRAHALRQRALRAGPGQPTES